MSNAPQPPPPVNGTRRRGLLLVGAVFVLGLICGSALTVIGVRTVLPHFAPHRPPPGMGHPERMMRHLDLTEEQRTQVHAILEERREDMHRTLMESADEIREILTPEQQRRFDEMRRRHERVPRGPRGRRGPGPPPDGP